MTSFAHSATLRPVKNVSKSLISVCRNFSIVLLWTIWKGFKFLYFTFCFEAQIVKYLYLETFQRQQHYNFTLNAHIEPTNIVCVTLNDIPFYIILSSKVKLYYQKLLCSSLRGKLISPHIWLPSAKILHYMYYCFLICNRMAHQNLRTTVDFLTVQRHNKWKHRSRMFREQCC